MVEEIVFHLGDCKTGTTSIQTVLSRGAWVSHAGPIAYPARFNDIPLAKTLSVPAEAPHEAERFGNLLFDRLRRSSLVDDYVATGNPAGADIAKHDIRIGHRWLRTSAAVADRSGIRARALWSHL